MRTAPAPLEADLVELLDVVGELRHRLHVLGALEDLAGATDTEDAEKVLAVVERARERTRKLRDKYNELVTRTAAEARSS